MSGLITIRHVKLFYFQLPAVISSSLTSLVDQIVLTNEIWEFYKFNNILTVLSPCRPSFEQNNYPQAICTAKLAQGTLLIVDTLSGVSVPEMSDYKDTLSGVDSVLFVTGYDPGLTSGQNTEICFHPGMWVWGVDVTREFLDVTCKFLDVTREFADLTPESGSVSKLYE